MTRTNRYKYSAVFRAPRTKQTKAQCCGVVEELKEYNVAVNPGSRVAKFSRPNYLPSTYDDLTCSGWRENRRKQKMTNEEREQAQQAQRDLAEQQEQQQLEAQRAYHQE